MPEILLSEFITTGIYSLPLWSLESPDSTEGLLTSSWMPISIWLYMVKKKRVRKSEVSFLDELIPIIGVLPSLPNRPPECSLQILSLRGLGSTWACEFEETEQFTAGPPILYLSVSFSEKNPLEGEWAPFKLAVGFILIYSNHGFGKMEKVSSERNLREEVGRIPVNLRI